MPQARALLTFVLGLVVGVVAYAAVRFAALPPIEAVHYHANWALWIDGARVDLTGDQYMEDVAACASDPANIGAHQRVHMHENNADIVHVHHGGATWGHLLQNLGWGIGVDWLYSDAGVLYRDEEGKRITYILNGLVVPPVYDRVIQPGDRLLISLGSESPQELLETRFPSVASNAPEYDVSFDPAGCMGAMEETLGARVRRAIWF
jgi:hypothetical protein